MPCSIVTRFWHSHNGAPRHHLNQSNLREERKPREHSGNAVGRRQKPVLEVKAVTFVDFSFVQRRRCTSPPACVYAPPLQKVIGFDRTRTVHFEGTHPQGRGCLSGNTSRNELNVR